MPLLKLISAVVLVALGLGLAAANLWFTAARSTIPLALDDMVIAAETRREKHPGHDDVYLIELQSRRSVQVDEAVYRAISVGQRLQKPRWSRQLAHDSHVLPLTWSRDFLGMTAAMPIVLLIVAATAAAATWPVGANRES